LKGDVNKAHIQKTVVDFENNIPDWHATVATPEGRIYVIGGADFRVHNHSSKRTYYYRSTNNSLKRLKDM